MRFPLGLGYRPRETKLRFSIVRRKLIIASEISREWWRARRHRLCGEGEATGGECPQSLHHDDRIRYARNATNVHSIIANVTLPQELHKDLKVKPKIHPSIHWSPAQRLPI